jgi:DNA-3-methyladenine glycosylase
VARDLLGCLVVRRATQGATVGMIVEVEAYCGTRDLACHSAGGRRTQRNEVMYGPPGRAYVYFTYGMHHCFNVVTRPEGIAEAVLVRAAVAVQGAARMRERRALDAEAPDFRLAQGPANLCRALAIDRRLNGADLGRSELTLHPGRGFSAAEIRYSTRIGIDYAGPYASKRWRFYVRDEPAVSGIASGRHRR